MREAIIVGGLGLGGLVLGWVFLKWKKLSLKQAWNGSGPFLLGICAFLFLMLLFSNRIMPGKWKLLRVLAYGALLYLMLRTFVVGLVRKRKEISRWKGNVATLFFALSVSFVVLEAVFLFRVRSHGSYPESFGNINWFRSHWQPLNSLGYRGEEPVKGKRKVLVLGDSFAGGWGINDYRKRFPEVLDSLLPSDIQVLNLGMPGSNTRGMTKRLKVVLDFLDKWDEKPIMMILAYVPNDIQEAADDVGKRFPWKDPRGQYPFFIRPLLHYSSFFNFLLAERGYAIEQENYATYLAECLGDPRIKKRHEEDLKNLFEVAEGRVTKVRSLVFPLMQDLEGSSPICETWAGFLAEFGECSRIGTLLAGGEVERFMVDPLDPHPSERVHKWVGELCFEIFMDAFSNHIH